MNDKFVSYSKDEIVSILADLNELVVSLDRIGSYWSDRKSDEEYCEIESLFLTDWDVARKLSRVRSILESVFSDEVGDDGMDELERKLQECNYWQLRSAFDSKHIYKIGCLNRELDISDFDDPVWGQRLPFLIDKDWGGRIERGRTLAFTGLWSAEALFVRFDCIQNETLVVSDSPQTTEKTVGLWDRDVCEIFIAPNANEPKKYFEFEVAPTGEWLDLAIDSTSGERVTDRDYRSGMDVAARIEENRVIMAMKIPWKAFGKKPSTGDVWLGNIFRCVGKEPDRGYLAWKPTFTEEPNFHVPEKFGKFVFE